MPKGWVMSIIASYSHFVYKKLSHRDEHCISSQCFVSGRDSLFWRKTCFGNILIENRKREGKKIGRRNFRVESMWPDLSRPSTVEMEVLSDSEQLDQILAHAQQNSEPVIIDWYFSFSILHNLFYIINVKYHMLFFYYMVTVNIGNYS